MSALELGRGAGKVWIESTVQVMPAFDKVVDDKEKTKKGERTKTVSHVFFIYFDTFVNFHQPGFLPFIEQDVVSPMIDPTEMVKRGWMISQLQQALRRQLPVVVTHAPESPMIQSVTVSTPD